MMHNGHMADRVGPAGRVLAANIQRIRKRKKLTFAEVSARTEEIGQPIAVLGLRRIERGERRVDFDDLLCLARALRVAPVDLMVPVWHTDTVPFPIGNQEFGCRTVHDWVAGATDALEPPPPMGRMRFASPRGIPDIAELDQMLRWLPDERRERVLRNWALEQYPDEEEQS
jgi:transcriptional regulator with XRE-family HTH domain